MNNNIDQQIDALTHATGLSWIHESTGGGHDALMAYFNNNDDNGNECPRMAYVMLTCDASVVQIGRDRHACLGYYPNVDIYDDCEREANEINDESDAPFTLDQLVNFVAETLIEWAVTA